MFSGKNQSSQQPYAYGSLLQAATYGMTIPTIYGTTMSNLLAIWTANLRQGGSGKKGKQSFSQKKSGGATYIENIDFLIGANPILGVLQIWNNGGTIPLAFTTHVVTGTDIRSISIPDPNFYAVLGVSIADAYDETFNDYGGQGPIHETGTMQIPFWNTLQTGPDPVHGSGVRNWPFCYRWEPGYGNTVYIDAPGISGVVTVYYAQLTAATSNQPPLARQRLEFEPVLGSGDEYANSNVPEQQILYPMYAGVGSSDIDLGSGGVIPQLQVETQGCFGLYSSGDADFADMIEDIFKSGIAQAAIGDPSSPSYTQMQKGLNASSFPGCIQRKMAYGLALDDALPYDLPNTPGNFLVVLASCSVVGGTLAISDTDGNTWTPVFTTGGSSQAWYATALGGSLNNLVTIAGFPGSGTQISIFELSGVNIFDAVVVGHNGAANITTSNTNGFASYILGIGLWNTPYGANTPNTPNWDAVLAADSGLYGGASEYHLVLERVTQNPGTYGLAIAGNPNQMCILAFKSSQPSGYPQPVEDFIDFSSLDEVRAQCRANGLYGSLTMNSQQAASAWLDLLYAAANAAPVFMGFKLFSIPYSEVSAVGNGSIFIAPTANGPIANLSTVNGDFITTGKDSPITVTTAARVNQPNVLQMQCINRTSNYNPSVVSVPDAGSIALYGVRKADPIQNYAVQDVAVARLLLGIQVRRLQYGSDIYEFTLSSKWALLAPMDLITVTDPLAGINGQPVRITSIQERSADGTFACEAQPFVYGMNDPLPLAAVAPVPYTPNVNKPAGDVNPPIIFQPTAALQGYNNQGELWIVISSPDSQFGGAQVYVSTDGGNSYTAIGNPTSGSATTGDLTADWPAANTPDTTNDLAVDLSESNGELQSYSVQTEDGFQYPCYVAGDDTSANARAKLTAQPLGPGNYINGVAAAVFSTLSVPSLPADAVIQGIYPVAIASFTGGSPALGSLSYGAAAAMVSGGPAAGTYFPGYPLSSSSLTELYGPSIGTLLSLLTGQGIMIQAQSGTTTSAGTACSAALTAAGYAIYYTSATPVIDSSIPPPFSVPSGQGVAWAKPLTFVSNFANNATVAAEATMPTQPYELMTYAVADLTGPNSYTLKATGTTESNSSSVAYTQYGSSVWQYVGNQFRTHYEPVVTSLSDLNFTNFADISIPAGSTILGIEVSAALVSQSETSGVLSQVSLWNGAAFGTVKTPNTPFSPVIAVETYGGPTDLWGLSAAALLAAVTSGTFGFAMAANVPDTVRVFIGQAFTITVYYQTAQNHLNRGVFGAPSPGVGNDHTIGSRFAFLSPDGIGIVKLPIPVVWLGRELFFKILSFNTFGTVVQSLAAATVYSYTPFGSANSQGGINEVQINGV